MWKIKKGLVLYIIEYYDMMGQISRNIQKVTYIEGQIYFRKNK